MPAEASRAHTRRNRCSGCQNTIFGHLAHWKAANVQRIFLLACFF